MRDSACLRLALRLLGVDGFLEGVAGGVDLKLIALVVAVPFWAIAGSGQSIQVCVGQLVAMLLGKCQDFLGCLARLGLCLQLV